MQKSTLCYLEKDGCYLMLFRNKKSYDPNRGKWIGVGGGFLPGEDALTCARREVLEETGLSMTEPVYRGVVDFLSDVWESEEMHLFTCSSFEGTLIECDEGELKWIPVSEVPDLPLWEGDRYFLRMLREDRPFFRMTLRYEGDRLAEALCDGESLLPPGDPI